MTPGIGCGCSACVLAAMLVGLHCLGVHRVVCAPGISSEELLPPGPLAWAVVFALPEQPDRKLATWRDGRRENTLADFYLGGRGIGFAAFPHPVATTYKAGIRSWHSRHRLSHGVRLHFQPALHDCHTFVYQFFAPALKGWRTGEAM